MAERKTATAAANVKIATMAGMSSQMRLQSGRCQKTSMNPTMTMDWNMKNTQAEPTDASGRISRGNATFLTSPLLCTIDPVALNVVVENRFQTNMAENM